jgi:hypothetical protein
MSEQRPASRSQRTNGRAAVLEHCSSEFPRILPPDASKSLAHRPRRSSERPAGATIEKPGRTRNHKATEAKSYLGFSAGRVAGPAPRPKIPFRPNAALRVPRVSRASSG